MAQNDMMINIKFRDEELPEEYSKRLGAFVHARRKDLGKSQVTISIETGLDSGAVSRIERGKQTPRMAVLYRLSKSLDMSMSDIIAAAEGVSDIDDLRKFLLYKTAPAVYRTMVDTALQATERENAQRNPPPSE